jgi:isopenicillin N synthase-like dioxygenase
VCPGREAVTTFASGDEWTALEPCEGAICINIGDMLMQWSDDRVIPPLDQLLPNCTWTKSTIRVFFYTL